jgi:hypothetical protein
LSVVSCPPLWSKVKLPDASRGKQRMKILTIKAAMNNAPFGQNTAFTSNLKEKLQKGFKFQASGFRFGEWLNLKLET